MKRALRAVDRYLFPTLLLCFFAIGIILLSVADNALAIFLAMLWAAALAAGMRWGIWGILTLAQKTPSGRPILPFLVRAAEVLHLLLALVAAIVAILLWEIPTVWLFLPSPLFGLQGALRFDVRYL